MKNYKFFLIVALISVMLFNSNVKAEYKNGDSSNYINFKDANINKLIENGEIETAVKYILVNNTNADLKTTNSNEDFSNDNELYSQIFESLYNVNKIIRKIDVDKTVNRVFEYDLNNNPIERDELNKIVLLLLENIENFSEEELKNIQTYVSFYYEIIDEELSRQILHSKSKTPYLTSSKVNYSGTVAADWASANAFTEKYASFPYFKNVLGHGGDCTNFASITIRQGGVGMRESWYCQKLKTGMDTIYPGIDFSKYWSIGDPWMKVINFTGFWRSKKGVDSYTASVQDYLQDTYGALKKGMFWKGDVVILSNYDVNSHQYIPKHAIIITSNDGKEFTYSAHTYSRRNEKLSNAFKSYDRFVLIRPRSI